MTDITLTIFEVRRQTRVSVIATAIFVVLALVLIAAPWWAGRADLRIIAEFMTYLALASLWNLLAGYAGLASVGQQAFVGLGAYVLFGMTLSFGVPPLLALPIAAIGGGMAAIVLAPLLFRLQGAYFAIGTWAAAEVFLLSSSQFNSLGGGSGTNLPASVLTSIAASRTLREAMLYWLSLAVGIGAVIIVAAILRSRLGLALKAVRDSEIAADSLGVSNYRTKLIVYTLTGSMTALVGAIIFLQKLRIAPDSAYSASDWTAFVIFIVVIGGIGTIEGPILGTIIFFVLRQTLADFGPAYLLLLGAIAIAVMLKAPRGIWGLIAAKTGWQLIATRRTVLLNGREQ
ncbi:branched-chain amino acid ABC transporter permease [Agrobacterium rhizogenes]|uniref:branched-chain amino acid ABC transporter permease n=1 Tax=Rhizobium rhizogenes TaxID=359 RepID=UPI000DDF3B93|nr:branched-chain amino acid ABC transporter permease [Rhizobium rhizogenes]KAA6487804.1 branched-chain amino acid ABC transporter permease [Agrobacterium sp. ICMP 7243]NTF83892.1 branched-chain amino acid ABC transporter permease [Rhizobium rhizogenes]NTF89528.1 branched-chain amino acid ABC transporter permease [Rhizobium rhizogenes]NTG03293.1 branched-chain amino acid ABC transporter permease [Rhizobium rhizogenes]NTG16775.1 branched-chain amino acid ABC transporter permease [Rhizobium rhiz